MSLDFNTISQDITKVPEPIVIKSAPINTIIRTFGILAIQTLPPQTNEFDGKITEGMVAFRDAPIATSDLGTPVMQDITFKSVTYTDFTTGLKRTTTDLKLQTILLNVTQAKKIVMTEIQGRDGTVKEYIGLDDFEITINGIINGQAGHNPTDDIISLKNNVLIPRVSIPVVCTYLNNLGITTITVKDFTLDQEAGGYSKQNFTINCLSDAEVVLSIL